MKLFNPFFISIQVLFVVLVLRSDSRAADDTSCAALLYPLESEVESIKGMGGIWGLFEKNYKVRNHARVSLKLDSKIMVLTFNLRHLCETQNGIPFGEIARVIVPILKEKGEQAFKEEMVNIGHTWIKAEELVVYARFAEKNQNRKLDFNVTSKTIAEAQPFVDRMVALAQKIGEIESDVILADAKVLISDIEKYIATTPYIIQALRENGEVPHARYITGDSDAM